MWPDYLRLCADSLSHLLLGNNIALCLLIISNPVHTNTTHEHHTFVYYYFLRHVSVFHSTIIRQKMQVYKGKFAVGETFLHISHKITDWCAT
jgi:hypothetical protein